MALDLGAGQGIQAGVLAERGFRVVALDQSRDLLDELRRRAAALPPSVIPPVAIQADLLEFERYLDESADVVVCLGDTLIHLPSRETVDELFRRVAARLSSGGRFILSLRDYATRELEGKERFILVRSDAERILTCFLEYAPEVVYVYDVPHTRSAPDGPWALRVSAYPKLRLAPEWIAARLGELGLRVVEQGVDSGQVVLAARKASAAA